MRVCEFYTSSIVLSGSLMGTGVVDTPVVDAGV